MAQGRLVLSDRIALRNRVLSFVKRLTAVVHGTTFKRGGGAARPILTGDTNANRTERPKEASGRDRCCCHGSTHRDRQNQRHSEGQVQQDQERSCGSEGARRETDPEARTEIAKKAASARWE